MSRGLRSWRGAAAAVAVMTLLSGCGGANSTPVPATPAPATPTPVPTNAPTPTSGLFVDAGADRGDISPLVYGTNSGPWISVPFEQQSKLGAASVRMVTFPGGNWGDENDITTDQVDQFIDFCKSINAEPRIVVRLKGGTVDTAVELLRYTNITMKYGVKYWGIGNEPDLYELSTMPDYNVNQFNKDWRKYATAMKALDPSIKLVGPDVSQFIANASDTYLKYRTDWLTSFLKANGDMTDVVSIHRYPLPLDAQTPPTVADLRGASAEWDSIIPALRTIIKTETGKDLPVAVTEVNSSWATNGGGDATMDSHMNAIWFADVLGRMIDQKVDIVDQFAIAGEWGIIGKSGPNPIYYDYVMYAKFGTKLVRTASDDPLVRVYAAKRADGTLTVMIVNLRDFAAKKPLTIVGGGAATSAETWLFDKTHSVEKVAVTPLTPGGEVTVPPESVTLLLIAK